MSPEKQIQTIIHDVAVREVSLMLEELYYFDLIDFKCAVMKIKKSIITCYENNDWKLDTKILPGHIPEFFPELEIYWEMNIKKRIVEKIYNTVQFVH